MELAKEEKDFIVYWAENRLKRRKVFKQVAVGLPLGVALVLAILVNFLSGWYKSATMKFNADGSMLFVLLIACVAIVVFIVVFSAKHRWDMYEQRYLELLAKRNKA